MDRSRPTSSHRLCRGFMVDVTADDGESIRRAVTLARQGMAPIQQSIGLLMGSLGLAEEAAVSVLKRVSSHHNVKVRDLAPRFMSAAVLGAGSTRSLSEVLLEQAAVLAAERSPDPTAGPGAG